jgi:hypothetical protein
VIEADSSLSVAVKAAVHAAYSAQRQGYRSRVMLKERSTLRTLWVNGRLIHDSPRTDAARQNTRSLQSDVFQAAAELLDRMRSEAAPRIATAGAGDRENRSATSDSRVKP